MTTKVVYYDSFFRTAVVHFLKMSQEDVKNTRNNFHLSGSLKFGFLQNKRKIYKYFTLIWNDHRCIFNRLEFFNVTHRILKAKMEQY